ncbi:hypothetical protein [Candidatus Tisiphia endosymbiont of Neophilaenus lineatus]|uniref:hypothetical protein n=1 Tax=Candidatus Tisiphia endosymbiont of Neophilaenus lineatus TaxID=3139336 RepID=UPI0035CB8A33
MVTSEIHSKTYPNGEVDEWTYLATWDPHNLDKKIYIREDEVLKQIEEVFKRIGNKKDLEMLKETLAY